MKLLERTTSKGPARYKHRAVIIGLIVAVLLVIGLIWWGIASYHADRLTQARESCTQSSEALRIAQNKYNTLHDGKAAEAAKITDRQVEDAKTVAALAAAYKEEAPDLAACNVQGVDRLREATAQIDKNAAWYGTHTASLLKAVNAVNESHDAKTLKAAKEALSKQLTAAQKKYKATDGKVQDDKTRKDLKAMIDKATKTRDGKDVKAMNSQAKQLKDLMGKADASVKAKQAAEEKARKEAAAQAQAQQEYVAPQQTYTPTYTAPQQTYTAPATPQYTAPAAPAQSATPTKPNTGSGPVSGGHGCNEGNCSSTPDLGYIPR